MTTTPVELISQTIDVWQPYSREPLSEADAKEINTNITQYFDLLNELDHRQNRLSPSTLMEDAK